MVSKNNHPLLISLINTVNNKLMTCLKPTYLLILLLFSPLVNPTFAQRKKAKQPKVNPIEVVRNIMRTGDYPQAQDYIAKELVAQKKLRRPTCNIDSLKYLADSMSIAEANIRSTQQVIFVDSVVFPLSEALQCLAINPDMGRVLSGDAMSKLLNISPQSIGESAYMNALADIAYFAVDKDSIPVLHRTIRTGQQWSPPEPLNISEQINTPQDFPFMLTDGVSLYYSAQADDALGGYDIYVTRYDSEEKTFLKPQNIGMPFNSAANDIMYVIDEHTNTGYFITDRRCPQDSVCLYTFIPNNAHASYPPETDFVTLYNAAHINSIAATQIGHEQRIAEWKAMKKDNPFLLKQEKSPRFIISNDVVYTHIDMFTNQEAKQIAQRLINYYASLQTQETLLNILRKQYSTSKSQALRDNILQTEYEREETIAIIKDLEKLMRKLELE